MESRRSLADSVVDFAPFRKYSTLPCSIMAVGNCSGTWHSVCRVGVRPWPSDGQRTTAMPCPETGSQSVPPAGVVHSNIAAVHLVWCLTKQRGGSLAACTTHRTFGCEEQTCARVETVAQGIQCHRMAELQLGEHFLLRTRVAGNAFTKEMPCGLGLEQ